MRCCLAGVLLAAVAAMLPAEATAGNQQTAERIALALKQSGRLRNYRIAVLYQNGTVWLKGNVATQEQMNTALELAFETPGVSRTVNHLAVTSGDTLQAAERPEYPPSRVPSLSTTEGSVSVPQSLLGDGPVPAAGRGTLPLVRGRNTSDRLPEPVPVSIHPLDTPRGRPLSAYPAQPAASSRFPWAPDIVVSGP